MGPVTSGTKMADSSAGTCFAMVLGSMCGGPELTNGRIVASEIRMLRAAVFATDSSGGCHGRQMSSEAHFVDGKSAWHRALVECRRASSREAIRRYWVDDARVTKRQYWWRRERILSLPPFREAGIGAKRALPPRVRAEIERYSA